MNVRWNGWTALAAYAAVIWAYFVLPLHGRFSEAMIGTSLFPHDAMLNAGILEWGRRALGSSSLHVFEWTAGFPLHNTLANTENLLGWQPEYALLRWAGFTVTFAYNTLIVTSFFLSAAGARLLAARLGADGAGAFLAGLIFAFTPFHLVHVIHLQTLSVCWAPFAVYFLDRFLSAGRAIDLACVAGLFVLSVLSGLYMGFFLAIALPVYAVASLAVGRFPLHRGRLWALAAAALGTSASLWPVLARYIAYSRSHGYAHPVNVLTRFSVELLALAKVPTWLALWSQSGYPGRTVHESAAFPGFVAAALFFYSIYSLRGEQEPAHKACVRILLVLSAVFFAFSLGPRLLFRENTPVPFAYWIPLPGRIFEVFSVVRWPMRAFLFSLLFGAVMAGLGFTAATRTLPPRWRGAVLAVVVLILFFEYRPLDRYAEDSVAVPDPLALSGAYRFLAADADRGGVVELPAADRSGYRTPMLVRSTYGSAGHLRRVVAIHGQGWPPLTLAILDDAQALPDPGAVDHLRRLGCSRVVVHRTWMPGGRMDAKIAAMRQAGLPVLWESDEAVVFALQ